MEPENIAFQKESPFPMADFQVNHVKLQGCSLPVQEIPIFPMFSYGSLTVPQQIVGFPVTHHPLRKTIDLPQLSCFITTKVT